MEKQIIVEKRKVSEIKTAFGNPRKIGKKKLEELKRSFEMYGDFGVFLIDENDNVIGGNQRLKVLKEINPEAEILCKKLVGYTEPELRAINIKDNIHQGEWDLDLLADWTADLNIDLGLELDNKDLQERSIKEMEPIRHEMYDYVMIVCKNEMEINELANKLGLVGKVVKITEKKRVQARAVWFKDFVEKVEWKKEEL